MTENVETTVKNKNNFAVTMPYQSFLDLTTVVAFASDDTARPIIQNVLVEIEPGKKIRVVATDSYRLAIIDRDLLTVDKNRKTTLSVQIAGAFLTRCAKSLSDGVKREKIRFAVLDAIEVTMTVAGNTVTVTTNDPRVADVLTGDIYTGGAYPDYRSLPPEHKGIGAVDSIAWNPHLIGDLKKLAPWRWDKVNDSYGTMARLVHVDGDQKPLVITGTDLKSGGITTALFMPMRDPDKR